MSAAGQTKQMIGQRRNSYTKISDELLLSQKEGNRHCSKGEHVLLIIQEVNGEPEEHKWQLTAVIVLMALKDTQDPSFVHSTVTLVV